MGARPILRGLVLALSVAGCTLAPAPPRVESLSPDWGYNGESTDIDIQGQHFFPSVVVDGSGEGGRIEGTFRAWLQGPEDVELEKVQHVDYETVSAEVPEGLIPGLYDLHLEVPYGLSNTLEGAFTVTDTRADHLQLETETVAYRVEAYAAVTVRLLDPADELVTQSMEVQVRATSASGASGVIFWPDGLDQQVSADNGIVGRLGEDGTGTFLVTSDVPDDVRIEVSPADEDSVVDGDGLLLSWDAGEVEEVELTFPEDGFSVAAGETFRLGIALRDASGNVIEDELADLFVRDECQGWTDPDVSILGQGDVEVTLTTACTENRLHAWGYGQDWTSDPFVVTPAALDRYDVQVAAESVEAGEGVGVLVEARDPYDNVVSDASGGITLRDDVGGLDPDLGFGEQDCSAFFGGFALCTASLWAAAPEVRITASDDGGVSGTADPIAVVPGPAVTLVVGVDGTSVTAGETFELEVRALDAFGNSVEFDPAGTDRVSFDDESDTLSCDWAGAEDGSQIFTCSITVAMSSDPVTATVLGLTAELPDPMTIENGPLALVEIEPVGTTFVAGEAFTLDIQGFDAYGNDYVVQTDPRLTLRDSAGTISPGSATLGLGGSVQVSAVITAAGPTRVTASQSGVDLGASRLLEIDAGELVGIEVTAPPWFVVGEAGDVDVSGVDAWDNAVPDYAGPVTLEAAGGGCTTTLVSGFYGGSTRVGVDCSTPGLAERLIASDESGFSGESETFDVVDLTCSDGPVAALTLDGGTESISCLAEGDSVEVVADTSGSTAGGAAISARHFVDGKGVSIRTLAADASLTYTSTGTRHIRALVVDSDACADLADGYVYIGPDDGEPTGPVTVSVSTSSVNAGDTVAVDVEATDCTGDVAAGQPLFFRADLGAIGLTSTGTGLELLLDSSGVGSFYWDFDTSYAGDATLWAGSTGGGAYGEAVVYVDHDAVRPQVVSVSPSGVELAIVDEIVVTFNEPILTLSGSSATLSGPDGAVDVTYSYSDDYTQLYLTPTTEVDGALGTWTVTLSGQVRDLDGNGLDGGWSGSRASASFTFGDVADLLPDVSSCAASVEAFVPDGDDGADEEADAVLVTPTATGSPEWWWLVVTDVSGERIRSLREAGTSTVVTWDGRGDDGRVVEAGAYHLALAAIDSNDNVGDTCDLSVVVAQHVDTP